MISSIETSPIASVPIVFELSASVTGGTKGGFSTTSESIGTNSGSILFYIDTFILVIHI